MDVRCEKCLTVYDFDETKVSDAGVTVKCTQCGNLFRVRRRVTYPQMPAASPATSPGMAVVPSAGVDADNDPNNPQTPLPTTAAPGDTRMWMLRSAATGEVRRFRELTTLQQWIVERRVMREDEISRTGDSWKRLGGISELASFFHVVEQADARAAAGQSQTQSEASFPARSTLPYETRTPGPDWTPSSVPAAPSALKPALPARPPRNATPPASSSAAFAPTEEFPAVASTGNEEPARLPDPPSVRSHIKRGGRAESQEFPSMPAEYGLADDDDADALPSSGGRAKLIALVAMLAVAALGAYVYKFKRATIRSWLGGASASVDAESLRRGRELALLDADDSLRAAEQLFQRAHGADDQDPQPLAALAELDALWSVYLRDDAKVLADANRGAQLRKEAQARLDDAKRLSSHALVLAPDDPDVNRAMATYLVASAAPAAQVEAYLKRVNEKRPGDPPAAYLRGALLARDGRPDEARLHLEDANKLERAVDKQDLVRANYLLAQIAFAAGRRDDARAAAEKVLARSSRHDRARALLAQIEAARAPTATPVAPTTTNIAPAVAGSSPGTASPPAAVTPTPPPAPVAIVAPAPAAEHHSHHERTDHAERAERTPTGESKGYASLISQGNHLAEHGHSREAQKLFEKALEERPDGVEALTGVGYCLLDTEHYQAATDRFRRVLSLSPGDGEAIIGLAESYKMRGDKAKALDFYRRYLNEVPSGSKAGMARTNVRELETDVKSNEARSPDPAGTPAP